MLRPERKCRSFAAFPWSVYLLAADLGWQAVRGNEHGVWMVLR